MLIALLDDGINPFLFPEVKMKYDLAIYKDEVTVRDLPDKIVTNHGTICARIIAKYAPGAEFCSLRIFNTEKLTTTCDQLIIALDWCMKSRVPIINLSLGSSYLSDYFKMKSLIRKILNQNQIIVSAYTNSKKYTSTPACIKGVFGVLADPLLKEQEYYFSRKPFEQMAVYASSRHNLSLLSEPMPSTQISNSYAAPTFTAQVHNLLHEFTPLSLNSLQVYKMLLRQHIILAR